jgi:predicted amidophosphoribosyltransferase
MNRCPNCGNTISEYATICPHCKTELNLELLKEENIKLDADDNYFGNLVWDYTRIIVGSFLYSFGILPVVMIQASV